MNKIYPFKYLLINLALFTVFISACNEIRAADKPNIIFILVDDLGKEWVSCYGAKDIHTPNIDALAESGIRFENVYSMPQCTPTRVALLTSQYPYRNGWVNHWDVPRWGAGCHFDPGKYPFILGKAMKQAGYATAAAGKWQIDDFRVEPEAMIQAGFDDWCMWTGYEEGVPASAERYWNPYINQKGLGSKTREGRFGPDVFVEFIMSFMEQNKDKPFFIYYPMVLVHTPLVTTPHEPNVTGNLAKHKAMVRYTDFLLGRLVNHLKTLRLDTKTILIWTTDNGTAQSITGTLGNRKVQGGKSKTTENGINAPFIAACPGIVPAGVVSQALIDFTDIGPTFADLVGLKIPQAPIVDGHSFADHLLGRSTDAQRAWILAMGGQNNAQVTDRGVENQFYFRDRVVRDQRYKLFIGPDRKVDKFLDLQSDPEEENDLTGSESPEALKARKALESVIDHFPERDNDPQYNPNPPQPWDRKITKKSMVWKTGYPAAQSQDID